MSEPNPYESPKEISPRPTVRAGVAIGTLLMLSIPAGCVAGCGTCYASAFIGHSEEAGLFPGIPLGLLVFALVPAFAVWYFERGKKVVENLPNSSAPAPNLPKE